MKKHLLLIIPLLIVISCEDKEEDKVFDSPFVGIWDQTFSGEYENADCTGDIDSISWVIMQAFGIESSLNIKENGSYVATIIVFGMTETMSGTWDETDDGLLCFDGENCGSVSVAADNQSFTTSNEMEPFCEDSYTGEETSQTDSTLCVDAGNQWYEASCGISEYTKQ